MCRIGLAKRSVSIRSIPITSLVTHVGKGEGEGEHGRKKRMDLKWKRSGESIGIHGASSTLVRGLGEARKGFVALTPSFTFPKLEHFNGSWLMLNGARL